jgi:hypothetical protein
MMTGHKQYPHNFEPDLQDRFSIALLRPPRRVQYCTLDNFDLTTCLKQYPHNFEPDGSQLSLPIMEQRSFVVVLK